MSHVQAVLAAHEIAAIDYNPIPGDPKRTDGYWIAIARCKCGHSSPPEHRANHLTYELKAAGINLT